MLKFDHLTAAQDNVRHANNDKDRLLVQLLTTMSAKIHQLEMKIFEMADPAPFDERVLDVLNVRSGSARDALGLGSYTAGEDPAPFDARVLSVIEENSYEAYGHIEAEIEEKLADFTESHCFTEAVAEAASSCLSSKVEEILDGILHDAIVDAIGDAEDIVRKGLRSIL